MSLKLGNTSIEKAYIGSTEIKRIFLGNSMIFENVDNPAPPVGINGYLEALNIGDSGELEYPTMFFQDGDFALKVFYKHATLRGWVSVESSTWYFNQTTGATDKFAIYVHEYDTPFNGYNYAYYMKRSTDVKWEVFRSNIAPSAIVDRTVLNTSPSSLDRQSINNDDVEFTSVHTGDIYSTTSISGVSSAYPFSGRNYLDGGLDSSFDNFLASGNAWSFGYKHNVAVSKDQALGQIQFARNNTTTPEVGNYTGIKYTSGEGFTFNGNEWLVSAGVNAFATSVLSIPADSWVTVTCDANRYVNVYVNGILVENYRWASGAFSNATVSNAQQVLFGLNPYNGSFNYGDSNSVARTKTAHGCFQGDISNLFIANGVTLTLAQVQEINGRTSIASSTNYGSVTHAWQLDDVTTGSVFAALKGGVAMNAKTY